MMLGVVLLTTKVLPPSIERHCELKVDELVNTKYTKSGLALVTAMAPRAVPVGNPLVICVQLIPLLIDL
jgi:hypothetical protein